MTGLFKFDELRCKTDRQLIQLIHNQLDAGVRAALQALNSPDDCASAEAAYRIAKYAHTESSKLIPLVREIGWEEWSGMKLRVEHLGGMLDVLAPIPSSTARLPDDDWFRAEGSVRTGSSSSAASKPALCNRCPG